MKLLRHGPPGAERPGLLDSDGRVRDLGDHVADLSADILAPELLAGLAGLDIAELTLVEPVTRFGPPVAGIRKILGIGLNYRSHAEETGAKPRDEPLVFSKAVTALSGPNDPIVIPKTASQVDHEVELAVIIGQIARNVTPQAALEHVAGYAVINDVSERAYQRERGGQFLKGKSADSFAPLGPWLVTKDEIADCQALGLWLSVNGEMRQRATTAEMIFPVPFLISHLSEFMTLEPGDVIATGTPAGVGLGRMPPVYLNPGDIVELGIDGLGQQRQEVVAFRD